MSEPLTPDQFLEARKEVIDRQVWEILREMNHQLPRTDIENGCCAFVIEFDFEPLTTALMQIEDLYYGAGWLEVICTPDEECSYTVEFMLRVVETDEDDPDEDESLVDESIVESLKKSGKYDGVSSDLEASNAHR